ncbi:MAG: AzlC family ABC transporter permease [Eubacteriales bacterium]|nr:AzlC family ABC transporter permease [Eubacteriales bacterium]
MGRWHSFILGARDALPVSLGYLSVSFTLGLAARQAGMSTLQASVMSLITNTSAGQFAGIASFGAQSPLMLTALAQAFVNLRYVLMSLSLTQRFVPGEPLGLKLLAAFDVTDELFALAMKREAPLDPFYYYGMMAATIPCWALGTLLGASLGNLLPQPVIYAVNVALYAMFIAVVAPPARQNGRILKLAALSMGLSGLMRALPVVGGIAPGLRVILIALPLSFLFARRYPLSEETP